MREKMLAYKWSDSHGTRPLLGSERRGRWKVLDDVLRVRVRHAR